MGVTQRDVMKRLQTKYALACKDFDLLVAETGIGYSGVWAPYRVFESAAWRHYMASKEPNDNLRWFDTVIPRGYFTQQFPFGFGGVDYLYLGRLISRKGVKIAAETCQRIGARLLVAGQGVQSYKNGEFLQTFDGTRLEGNVQYLGVLNPTERAAVMGQVRAVFMPTWYLEPGGGVAIEAQLCGTPVITTPWGAMTETVLEGPQRTGFHCSVMSEFVSAAEHVETLDRVKIRQSAQARFSSKVIASKYDYYFKRLQTLYREGWYQ
jgi:glycosyltransferase involved in cell wall biosynthesis